VKDRVSYLTLFWCKFFILLDP